MHSIVLSFQGHCVMCQINSANICLKCKKILCVRCFSKYHGHWAMDCKNKCFRMFYIFLLLRWNSCSFMQMNHEFKKCHLRRKFVLSINSEKKQILPIFNKILMYLLDIGSFSSNYVYVSTEEAARFENEQTSFFKTTFKTN